MGEPMSMVNVEKVILLSLGFFFLFSAFAST